MADQQIDWSRLYKCRYKVGKRYKDIWKLPVEKRPASVVFAAPGEATALLEIGAGDRHLKEKIDKRWSGCAYKSFDIDQSRFHDFYSLDDIEGEYDRVCMFEIIEHVSPEIALATLSKSFEVLKPGGLLFVSTPNIYYPPAFLRDATHITPWAYDELGGIAAMAGFEVVELHRLYKESALKTIARRFLGYPLFRLLGIDYAKQIVLTARKPVKNLAS